VKPASSTPSVALPEAAATSTRKSGRSTARAHLIGFTVYALALVAAFINPLLGLIQLAAHSALHSHVLLVPFVSAYLLHVRKGQLPRNYEWSLGWAAVWFLIGTASLSWAWIQKVGISRNDFLSLTIFAFICFFVAGGFACLGRKWVRAATFPLFFLAFMIPMPEAMANALETASQIASTEAANFFFNITQTPVLRDGTVFQLPGITIQVAQECSGIRSSWVLLITSFLAANLFLNSTWRRAVLVGFVIPLGIVRNGLRIWTIGTLCIQFGPQMIHSAIHRKGGPLFFALSLVPLFLVLLWLRRGEEAGRNTSEKSS
jgi:exosortase C (VPDSG-CTERM-specific)